MSWLRADYAISKQFLLASVMAMLQDLLLPMFEDDYYPDSLVSEIKQHILCFAQKLKANLSDAEIYHFAQQTTSAMNKMKPKFSDLDSSLDDSATDYIAEAMMMVLQEAGYLEFDIEELVANREW